MRYRSGSEGREVVVMLVREVKKRQSSMYLLRCELAIDIVLHDILLLVITSTSASTEDRHGLARVGAEAKFLVQNVDLTIRRLSVSSLLQATHGGKMSSISTPTSLATFSNPHASGSKQARPHVALSPVFGQSNLAVAAVQGDGVWTYDVSTSYNRFRIRDVLMVKAQYSPSHHLFHSPAGHCILHTCSELGSHV